MNVVEVTPTCNDFFNNLFMLPRQARRSELNALRRRDVHYIRAPLHLSLSCNARTLLTDAPRFHGDSSLTPASYVAVMEEEEVALE